MYIWRHLYSIWIYRYEHKYRGRGAWEQIWRKENYKNWSKSKFMLHNEDPRNNPLAYRSLTRPRAPRTSTGEIAGSTTDSSGETGHPYAKQMKWYPYFLLYTKIHQPLVWGRLIFSSVIEKAQATTTKPWPMRLFQIRSFFTAKVASSPVKKWLIRYSSENELICRIYREFECLNF